MGSHNFFSRDENKLRSSDRPLDLGRRNSERGSSDRHSFITSLLVRVSGDIPVVLVRQNEEVLTLVPAGFLTSCYIPLEKIMEVAKLGPEISDV
jgi:hypothetical protein